MKKLLLLFLLATTCAHAQQYFPQIIEGHLTDAETGQPVPYASIGILEHPIGTSSNVDGFFTLRVPVSITAGTFKIKISSIGYENVEIENPSNLLELKMKPSVTVLKETIIFSKNTTPEKIVKKAFAAIKKNYNTKPFVYKNFYRHYCKDDSVYGRLIEAAVDVYKRKGYKAQQSRPGEKDEVRVTQLRRSFDKTKVSSGHVPIALYSILATDFTGFQQKTSGSSIFFPGQQLSSRVKINLKVAKFELAGITEFDNQQVYKITYSIGDSSLMRTGVPWIAKESGVLYINTKDHAFVKVESFKTSGIGTIETQALYRKYQNKYYLYHAVKVGKDIRTMKDEKFDHWYHIESITTDIITKDFEKFRGGEPDREKLFSVPYDSAFWNTYNILKATPLEDQIVTDIGKHQSLDKQFVAYDSSERRKYFSGKEDEEKFNRFLTLNKGHVTYIDFWASWCGPCVREMPASKELVEKYKGRVHFVYVSLDGDLNGWRAALERLDIKKPWMVHFRIGPFSDAANLFEIQSIPRYVLVDKRGNFVDLNAKRPSDPELKKDLDRLLEEKIEN